MFMIHSSHIINNYKQYYFLLSDRTITEIIKKLNIKYMRLFTTCGKNMKQSLHS